MKNENLMNLDELVIKLHEIKEKGYIPTRRRGNTGVGHTLEQELGLIENNIALPDIGDTFELKAARKDTASMLTLFTKEPLSEHGRGRDKFLLSKFGYSSNTSGRTHDLYTTISANEFNPQGFKLEADNGLLRIIHRDKKINIYWTYELLRQAFETKLPSLIFVLAECRGEDYNEEFYYNEAYLLKNFDFNGFINAINEGYIKVDLRMHLKESGASRNHGTAFRIVKSKIALCFTTRERIL
jgi:hypothetical protein